MTDSTKRRGRVPPGMDFWCNRCGQFAGRAIPTVNAGDVLLRHKDETGCSSRTFHGHTKQDASTKSGYTLTLTLRREEKPPI